MTAILERAKSIGNNRQHGFPTFKLNNGTEVELNCVNLTTGLCLKQFYHCKYPTTAYAPWSAQPLTNHFMGSSQVIGHPIDNLTSLCPHLSFRVYSFMCTPDFCTLLAIYQVKTRWDLFFISHKHSSVVPNLGINKNRWVHTRMKVMIGFCKRRYDQVWFEDWIFSAVQLSSAWGP